MNNKIALESLRVLDAVDSAGSYQAAAEMLHKVPSAISHAIHKLEEDLGVALFERVGRRSQLTPAGREVLQEGRRILRAVAQMQFRAHQAAGGWEPEFTVALDHMLPLRLLLPALQEFSEHAPEVRVNIIRETLDGTWDALIWRRADLAIGAGGLGPPGNECSAALMGELDTRYVAAPDHPLALSRGSSSAEIFSEHRYIDTADTARAAQPRTQMLSEARLRLSLVDLRDKLEALRAGLGFGLLPASLAQAEIAAGRLLEIPGDNPAPTLSVHFAVRKQAVGKALGWFQAALEASGSRWLDQCFG